MKVLNILIFEILVSGTGRPERLYRVSIIGCAFQILVQIKIQIFQNTELDSNLKQETQLSDPYMTFSDYCAFVLSCLTSYSRCRLIIYSAFMEKIKHLWLIIDIYCKKI